MKCPLIFAGVVSQVSKIRITSTDCLEEECALWNSYYGKCDPTGLISTAERLTDILSDIKEKMPHEGQFRK